MLFAPWQNKIPQYKHDSLQLFRKKDSITDFLKTLIWNASKRQRQTAERIPELGMEFTADEENTTVRNSKNELK